MTDETPPSTRVIGIADTDVIDVNILMQQAAVLHKDEKWEAAADLYRRALMIEPGNPNVLHLLGMCHHAQGDHRMGMDLLKAATKIDAYEASFHNLGVICITALEVESAVAAHRNALRAEPNYDTAACNLIFALDHYAKMTPELLLEERRDFNARFAAPLTEAAPPHENDRNPERRLRIGYVSADFKLHSASASFMQVVLNHDPRRFETYLYSTPAEPFADQVTVALKEKADAWADVGDLSDLELAELIRKDGIDILVDLSAYSARGRPLMFARKPAPIQVTAWGYATGTGLDAMDYLVSDPVTIPESLAHLYTERIMRLPCLIPFAPGMNPVEIGPLPFDEEHHIVFGYLGRAVKLHQEVFATWARILRRVPRSRLLLKGNEYRDPVFRDKLAETFTAMGVDTVRVEILPGTTMREHRGTYNRVDISLDTWPCGGGTTTLESLMMGVPVVTLLGRSAPSRQTAGILSCLGLTETITETVDRYVDVAVELAADLERLRFYRHTLRGKLFGSIICDGPGYTRLFEKKLRDAWREWCSEQRRQAKQAA